MKKTDHRRYLQTLSCKRSFWKNYPVEQSVSQTVYMYGTFLFENEDVCVFTKFLLFRQIYKLNVFLSKLYCH